MRGGFFAAAGLAAALAFGSMGEAAAQRLDRRVVIINNTSETMVSFQASNVRRNTWEEDIFGDKVLRPGQRITVNIDDGTGFCIFDFRATFQSGRRLERRRVNVCEISTFTYNN